MQLARAESAKKAEDLSAAELRSSLLEQQAQKLRDEVQHLAGEIVKERTSRDAQERTLNLVHEELSALHQELKEK